MADWDAAADWKKRAQIAKPTLRNAQTQQQQQLPLRQ